MVLVLGLHNRTVQSASCHPLSTPEWALQHILGQSSNAACSMELGHFSCFQALWSAHSRSPHQSQLDCLVQVMCRAFSPDCRRGYTTDVQSQFSSSHILRTGSPVPPPIGSALMCFPDEVYVHIDGWRHLIRVQEGSCPVIVSSEG